MSLSDAKIRAAKAGDKPRKLFDGSGLYLEVSPSGGKHWKLKYRYNGKESRLSLGAYPDVGLARARELRDKARAALAAGKNPAVEEGGEPTFREVTAEWFAKIQGTCKSTHLDSLRRTVKKWLLPGLGDIPVDRLTPRKILDVVQKAEDAGRETIAHLALATAGRITSYARLRGYCEHNAGSGLRGALRKHTTKHRAAITEAAGVGDLLRRIDALKGNAGARRLLRLMPYVFLRPMELASLRWEDVDWEAGEIVLPPERMKGKLEHVVPMARQVRAMLQELHAEGNGNGFVFRAVRDPEQHIRRNTLARTFGKLGYSSDDATMHGFRTTASTWLNEMKFNPDAVERQLSHREPNAVRDAYNRAQYLPERREMMQAWADYLDRLRDGK
jgi:integrase